MNEQHFSSAEIAEILNVKAEKRNIQIEYLLTDSRRLSFPQKTCFFAIKTNLNDGHKYIEELINKGVQCFVVEHVPNIKLSENIVFIKVKNTIGALQKISAKHREKFDIPILAITGSNGKTIIKEWLTGMLSKMRVISNYKSYNSQIGVPLSVWNMSSDNDFAIFEVGISQVGEMQNLQKIIRPKYGLFTNIGTAHSSNFISDTEKIHEKLKLFVDVDMLFYCKDHKKIDEAVVGTHIPTFTWSCEDENANIFITNKKQVENGTSLMYTTDKISQTISIPFKDAASIENALHCLSILLFMKFSHDEITQNLQSLHSLEMRLEMKKGINNCEIINDSYIADFTSLKVALDFATLHQRRNKFTVILSDVSGTDDANVYKIIAQLFVEKKVDRLIGIGEKISAHSNLFNIEKYFYPNTQAFLQEYSDDLFKNETILLKGARVYEFEKINSLLQNKTHETIMEIDFSAMKNNLNYYRSLLNPNTKIMVMTKAFSYGSGTYEIADFLQFNNVDYLAVAYTDEGVELRRNGIKLPIMVMNYEHAVDKILQYNLEPEIYNIKSLNALIAEMSKHDTLSRVKIHLKVDTGMRRLGFIEDEIEDVVNILNKHQNMTVMSVFSHLAGSDSNTFDDFTDNQIFKFTNTAQTLEEKLGYKFSRHILNSAGIKRFNNYQFDMVRLGIGLYGIGFDDTEQKNLIPVSTLKTIIAQIKTLYRGESVGYNRAYIASRDHKIATLAIGYADGLSRMLGNGVGRVLVNGQIAPIIGNICMDMCTISLDGIDAQEGDIVIIFGKELAVQETAKACNTIPYEILTSISQRVKRIYYQE